MQISFLKILHILGHLYIIERRLNKIFASVIWTIFLFYYYYVKHLLNACNSVSQKYRINFNEKGISKFVFTRYTPEDF